MAADKTLIFDFYNLSGKDKAIASAKRFFARAGATVTSVDVEAKVKKVLGVDTREVQFGFADSQTVSFGVTGTGDIYQVKVRAEVRAVNEAQGRNGGGGEAPGFLGTLMGSWLGRLAPLLLSGITGALGLVFSPIGLAIAAAATLAWGLFTEDGRKFFTGIGEKISAGWEVAVAKFSALWEPIAKWLSDKFGIVTDILDAGKKKIADAGNAANDAIREKTGIDVKETVAKATDTVQTSVVAPVRDKVASVKDTIGEKVIDPVREGAAIAADKAKSVFGKGSAGNKAALMQGMQQAGITDPKEQAMFMAQMDHESGGFRSLEENVRYRPKQFLKLFGKRAGIKTEEEARAILDKGEAATADAMYGGEWGKKNLGNIAAGDALKFKGRGFTQLTGRSNYEAAAKATGLDLVNNPELAADPANAAKIATWYWQSRKGLSDAGKSGDVMAATKKINGGTIGLDDRKEKYAHYLAETTKIAKSKTEVAPATAQAAAPEATKVAAASVPVVATAAPPAPPPMSVPSISVPATPSIPPTAEASIPMPLNSKAPLEVTLTDNQMVGQDIRDRRLAAIATGGMSS